MLISRTVAIVVRILISNSVNKFAWIWNYVLVEYWWFNIDNFVLNLQFRIYIYIWEDVIIILLAGLTINIYVYENRT